MKSGINILKNKMNINQKDVVLLRYPFTNLEGMKVRPALVVSNESFNKKSDDCIMVPLTTVIKDEPYSVIIDNKNIVTIKIGKINNNTLDKVKTEILKMF